MPKNRTHFGGSSFVDIPTSHIAFTQTLTQLGNVSFEICLFAFISFASTVILTRNFLTYHWCKKIGKLAIVKPGVKRRFIPVALLGSPLSSATSSTLFTKQKLSKTRDRNQYRDISQVGDPVTCVAISNELLTKHGMYVY